MNWKLLRALEDKEMENSCFANRIHNNSISIWIFDKENTIIN